MNIYVFKGLVKRFDMRFQGVGEALRYTFSRFLQSYDKFFKLPNLPVWLHNSFI